MMCGNGNPVVLFKDIAHVKFQTGQQRRTDFIAFDGPF